MKKLIWLAFLLPFIAQANTPDPAWGSALTLKDMPKECQSGVWKGGPIGFDPWYPNGTTVWSVHDGLLKASDIAVSGGFSTFNLYWGIEFIFGDGETGPLNVSFSTSTQRGSCSLALISAGLI